MHGTEKLTIDPPKYGKATLVKADNTSAQGVNDPSRNQFRQTNAAVRKTPVDEQVRNNEAVRDRTTKPKTIIAKRSSSVPVELSRGGRGSKYFITVVK